ncbi:MAG: TIGR01459 family HAD-type hydrolase, partial [Pseudomonadota bacterium]
MTEATATRLVTRLEEISGGYDALLCDLWGCFHNGVAPYPAAVAALQRFRAGGGAVVMLTNAPRPHGAVQTHLDAMSAPRDAYDAIVSSGDATRAEIESGRHGCAFHIVGPARDAPIWRGLDIDHAPLERAEAILCTGLYDDAVETPDDYMDLVQDGVARGLPFLCANPDVIVDRGDQRLYCAGAIAERYAGLGGRVLFFGKPHPPIYALALGVARGLRPGLATERVLALGDG